LLNRQKLLEAEMIKLGIKRYRDENLKARRGKHESTTPPGIQFIRKSVSTVSKRIEKVLRSYHKGEPAKYPVDALQKVVELDCSVQAFLALKGCINHLSTPVRLVKVAQEIGSFIEDEARFRYFKRNNSALFGVVVRDLSKRTTNYRRQKRVLVHSSNKDGQEWNNWPISTRIRLGQMLIEFICETTKLFEIKKYNQKNKGRRMVFMLEATKSSLEWIDKKNSLCELLSPVKMPCIIPPRKWTSIYDGGYYVYTDMHLVKSTDVAYKQQLETRDLSMVFDAVNTVQETGWKINKEVFSVMDHLFTQQSTCKVVPEFEERTMPKPYPKEGTKDEQIEWKREATHMHSDNQRRKTKRIQFAQLMWMARKFKDEQKFFFPHTIDFRGRLYANTAFLNPQGEDSARGLLEFAESKKLGDSGLAWLAIHGANCFGEDKISLEDRYEWTTHHEKSIRQCGSDPLAWPWWMEADKPWQFLRFCIEWTKANNDPECVSAIPVTVDGSCNGLQHFAGMLRDRTGGQSVNLLPNDVPTDIYDIVRQEVVKRIELDNSEEAELWDNGKDVSRAIVKRPVMTTPYGATLYGMRNQIHEELKKQLDKGQIFATIRDGVDLWPHCKYLARHIYDAIGSVVVSARQGMQWLQDVASILAKEDKCLYWTLPTGFVVKQKYLKSTVERIVTVINGQVASLFANNHHDDKLHKERQRNGVAPNFVHSLDACHLMFTILEARRKYDIESFSIVHDSFGTHACDMERLAIVIRTQFIKLYKGDVLGDFRDQIQAMTVTKLPEMPQYGILNINEVMESEFFFS